MMRSLLAVLAGWAVLAGLVMLGFIGGAMALGIDRVLEPGRYEATTLWLFVAAGIGATAALAAGFVCQRIASDRRTAAVFACAILAFGISQIFVAQPEPSVRPADQTPREALIASADHGREPLSTRLLNPLLGFCGILVGARLARR